ncbi:hypothetical protein JQN72_07775 [Phycicoccus sp. CSK15P-2]|uniref:hypothetical protein n=1 Tax=Phycicoccus sp. CSK15P-2 TaxID=2807627 RepID=UPI001950809E|nr:hypothetical protein [Phycicoccus sp. CSK15P-2]MBM6404141.1 hypothetical protein [Phycicoccus sp. CSK15P-2]
MTIYRVDAESVIGVGESLAEVAEGLALMGDPAQERWATGAGDTGPALEELLGAWRHVRLALAKDLAALGEAAADVGGLYLDTEAEVCHGLGRGAR